MKGVLRCLSRLALNEFKDFAKTTESGREFHWFTILLLKKSDLSLQFLTSSLTSIPLCPPLGGLLSGWLCQFTMSILLRILYCWIRSPRNLRHSREQSFNFSLIQLIIKHEISVSLKHYSPNKLNAYWKIYDILKKLRFGLSGW